jgi:hypothetical protein
LFLNNADDPAVTISDFPLFSARVTRRKIPEFTASISTNGCIPAGYRSF